MPGHGTRIGAATGYLRLASGLSAYGKTALKTNASNPNGANGTGGPNPRILDRASVLRTHCGCAQQGVPQ
jgi:hypothetical protein